MKLPLTLALDAHGLPRVFSDPAAAMAALASQPDVPSELFLVELQGQLEVQLQLEDDADPSTGSLHAGHKIGKLDMSVPTRPVLLIGHHRLVGQIVKLNTPLAILKHSLPPRTLTPSSAFPASSPLHQRNLTTTPATLEQRDNEDGAASSPLKRDRSASPDQDVNKRSMLLAPGQDDPSKPTKHVRGTSPATPLPARATHTPTGSLAVPAPLASTPFPVPAPSALLQSSAISSRTHAPNTPLNVSELRNGKHEIAGIIRSKILFSKRPEPIVKLDDESDDE